PAPRSPPAYSTPQPSASSCPFHHPFYFLLSRHPPCSTLFPYTTLFRSWCDPEILQRLRRASLAALRREVEAAEQATLGRFLPARSEEHTSELQSRSDLVCRLLLEKKKTKYSSISSPK